MSSTANIGSQTPYKLLNATATTGSPISPDLDVVHLRSCRESPSYNLGTFELKCLGPSNFTTANQTILYNCPLDCSFDRNVTTIDTSRTVNVTRQQLGLSINYTLTSNLFPNFHIICDEVAAQGTTVRAETSEAITSHSITTKSFPLTSERETNPSSSLVTSTSADESSPTGWLPPVCTNGNIGLACNISTDLCEAAQPCQNGGSCINTSSSTYECVCLQGFTGVRCEIDNRPCRPWTCLGRGQCNETSPTTFHCDCDRGYDGRHCERRIDLCHNVTCKNSGVCRTTLLNFTCECSTHDYTGRYCEVKSTSLVIKIIVNRSFGYVAIIALVGVVGVVVVMDVLKYVFNIDPVSKERQRLAARRRRRQQQVIKFKATAPIRFVYVDTPSNS